MYTNNTQLHTTYSRKADSNVRRNRHEATTRARPPPRARGTSRVAATALCYRPRATLSAPCLLARCGCA
eukprot:scaffold20899_cov112-Isochrysis_galbana.AAC.2